MKANTISRLLPILLSLVALPLWGQGIVFSEYRVVMNADRLFTLQVCNPTQNIRSYQLLIEEKQMNTEGRIVSVPDTLPLASSLRKQIRVFPKRMVLQPGECQAVQIQLKNTSVLPQGEFRSYLHFLPLATVEVDTAKQYTTAVPAIAMRIGAAIPIIFRKGSRVESITIDSVRMDRSNGEHPQLSLVLRREGSQSTYGTLRILSRLGGKEVVVKELPGYAVLPEVNRRSLSSAVVCKGLDTDVSGRSPFIIQYVNQEKESQREVLAQWEGLL